MTTADTQIDTVSAETVRHGDLAVTVLAGGQRVRKVTARNYPNVIVRWYLANPYDKLTGTYDRDTLKLYVDVVKATGDWKVAERTYQRLCETHRTAGVAWILNGRVRSLRQMKAAG